MCSQKEQKSRCNPNVEISHALGIWKSRVECTEFSKRDFFRGVAMEAAAELEAWRVGFNPQMIH